jgi:hypothetical protein
MLLAHGSVLCIIDLHMMTGSIYPDGYGLACPIIPRSRATEKKNSLGEGTTAMRSSITENRNYDVWILRKTASKTP